MAGRRRGFSATPPGLGESGFRTPLVDLSDEGDHYEVVLDVPGATKDDVHLSAGPLQGTLLVRVDAKASSSRQPQRVLRAERGTPGHQSGTFERVVPVGWDADVSSAKPSIDKGVLTISIPKQKEEKERASKSKS